MFFLLGNDPLPPVILSYGPVQDSPTIIKNTSKKERSNGDILSLIETPIFCWWSRAIILASGQMTISADENGTSSI
jgi:hypothetical protein